MAPLRLHVIKNICKGTFRAEFEDDTNRRRENRNTNEPYDVRRRQLLEQACLAAGSFDFNWSNIQRVENFDCANTVLKSALVDAG